MSISVLNVAVSTVSAHSSQCLWFHRRNPLLCVSKIHVKRMHYHPRAWYNIFFFFVRCHLCVLVTLKMFAGFSGLTCWPKQHWWCHFRGLRVCKVLKKRWVGIGGINDMFARRLSFMSKLKRYFGKMVLREIQEIKRDWPYLLTEATGQTRWREHRTCG